MVSDELLINAAIAMKVPGIEAIYTWEDVPQDAKRYTQAGQTYPEASPYDRLLIDRHVRFQGDIVAIVAGKDEKCVDTGIAMTSSTTKITNKRAAGISVPPFQMVYLPR